MEANMYLLICFLIIIAMFISPLWDEMEEDSGTKSELHARDRYATAEKIAKEFNDEQSHF